METNAKSSAEAADLSKLVRSPQFWADAERVFFDAMIKGQEDYVSAPWTVKTRPLTNSVGDGYSRTVEILYHKEPVWVMHTIGSYSKRAVSCLTAALKMSYEHRKWFAGRGQRMFVGIDASYRNVCSGRFDEPFTGKETIRFRAETLGEAVTFGRPLVKVP